ncbi:hypothetical protein SporoP8_12060 [Sporosarcina ureae]|nr:hypothetical protein SporoP8_12060 [Sporosarcina ureae]
MVDRVALFAGHFGEGVGQHSFRYVARVDVGEVAELPIGELRATDAVPFRQRSMMGMAIDMAARPALPTSGPPHHHQLFAMRARDAGCQVFYGKCVLFD